MALIANTTTPMVSPIPAKSISNAIAQRFPTPPMAWGFTELVDFDFLPIERVTWFETNAVGPEGSHMEKRKGQIWPR